MNERSICDIAVPLELLQELLGLPQCPVSANYSSLSNLLYLRIPATEKYTKCFSAQVKGTTKTGATLEMFRYTLEPPEPTRRGERIPTYDYIPTSMGEIQISTDRAPEHAPAEEFINFPTSPEVFNRLVGAEEGTFDQIVVNGIVVHAHHLAQDIWVTFPARNIPCQ